MLPSDNERQVTTGDVPPKIRLEQEIFDELATVCSSKGYVHAIAYLCYRDNLIRYSGQVKVEDLNHMFSATRLIRTETSTLIGLLIKGEIDYTLPTPDVMQQYLDRAEALLQEIHQAMLTPWREGIDATEGTSASPHTSGDALREPIFYGGESAYSFQYRDLAPRKYANDDEWLKVNKGFSIDAAKTVVHTVNAIQNEVLTATTNGLRRIHPDRWTFLPGYQFTSQQVADRAGLEKSLVDKVLKAFTVAPHERNDKFRSIQDFNVANVCPLLHTEDDGYILFSIYSLAEALYDNPFYWMTEDETYLNTAAKNRGRFAEEFSAERLALVFGSERVHTNVEIFESKSARLGEIDVLVIFGNRAVVLQAKSKRLTLEARKGNDGRIKDDFSKSIQESCDQGFKCAKILGNRKYRVVDARGDLVSIPENLKEIYVLCVVADHYPALAFQARQFLRFDATSNIPPPFVLDVFTLDAMTEMLSTPLQLVSYLNRRAKYSDRILAGHETTILSYHLKRNLWLDDEFTFVTMHDDISAGLDLAMSVRRDGVPGKPTPDGILTRFSATTMGQIVHQIEQKPSPATIDLGFLLLTLGEDTVREISKGIKLIASYARKDGKNHDVTVYFSVAQAGLTIHCNEEPIHIAGSRLEAHCVSRKYRQRADRWFGICISPRDLALRFGINLEYEWVADPQMDARTAHLPDAGKLNFFESSPTPKTKIGPNDICPCGSGKKYKKCCRK